MSRQPPDQLENPFQSSPLDSSPLPPPPTRGMTEGDRINEPVVVVKTIDQQESNNNNNNNNNNKPSDLNLDQSELERRRQELEIKAAELAAREEALRQGGGEFRRQHNWPPLPSFCPIQPCFFQDINVDIRPEFQKTVQLGYHLWVAFVFTQLLNIIAAILLLTYGVPEAGQNISFGLMTSIFLVPLTYMSWFRPLYKAFKNDSSFNFMVFFFVFFMQTLIVSLWSLGLPTQGPCGLYVALKNMGTGIFLALVLFLCTGCWMAYAVASVLYLLKVHSIYRSSGASMAKARSEFTQGIVSNQYVQQAAVSAARQTVNQTFGATANNQPPGGSR